MDKRDIRYIAEVMVEELREMNDGEATSTFQLFSEYGYDNDEYDSDDLFALHDLLFRFARAKHIKLDMSGFQKGAAYREIKAYVKEHTGLTVASLYIA